MNQLPVHDDSAGVDDPNAPQHYGLLWWNNADETLEGVPLDTYIAWGLYEGLIIVIPSLDLVISRAGPNRSPERTENMGHYDAPEPWGPWTTAYFTERWDVGPGESGSFPTAWMSEDGRTMHLVFSGDDFFSVRKATVLLAEETR